MAEQMEMVIIRGQQKFDLHDVLNLAQIEITDDRILNKLKRYKSTYSKLTPIGILFPSLITNNTKQIFVTCRELNDGKFALINGKVYNILGVINLDKISNWELIKGKSLWVNEFFAEQEQIKNSEHLCFSFKTLSLSDLLSFNINLIDERNKQIEFSGREKK